MPRKFHVALSFAGEDRVYVEAVAAALRSDGVDVFYDKFEEVDLWGKDLYTHLSDVYQNSAVFTVMFVSDAYRKKLWTNHERKSAQARAFAESQEYILPAFFDETVEVPGLLRTTGHIGLVDRTPAELAELIVKKLRKAGVRLKQAFAYAEEAKADVDFPLRSGNKIADIIKALKKYDWYVQSPAIVKLLALDWTKVSADEAFVLGRNIYQCACGNENRSVGILDKLRQELASIPLERALDLLNGMFFEVYFDSAGEFRSAKIKGRCLEKLLAIQTVKKYEPSIMFIQRALEPYRKELPFVPATTAQEVIIELNVKRSAPPVIKALTLGGRSLLREDEAGDSPEGRVWRLSYRSFTLKELKALLAEEWSIPLPLLTITADRKLEPKLELELPEGTSIRWPGRP
jgi:TIR domain